MAWSLPFGLALVAVLGAGCLVVVAPNLAGGTSVGTTPGGTSSSGGGTTSGGETGASSSGGTTSGQPGTSSSSGTTGSSTGQSIGTLWIGGLVALGPTALAQSGNAQFDMACGFPGSNPVFPTSGLDLIDGRGDLWAFDPGGILYMWTPDQLSMDCNSGVPELTLDLGRSFGSLEFDSAGNLWGTSTPEEAIYGFRAADLQTSGQCSRRRGRSRDSASRGSRCASRCLPRSMPTGTCGWDRPTGCWPSPPRS